MQQHSDILWLLNWVCAVGKQPQNRYAVKQSSKAYLPDFDVFF